MSRGPRRLRLSMASRILLSFSVLILPVAIISGSSYRRSLDDRRDTALEESVRLAQTAAAVVQGLLRDLDGTSLAMSEALEIQPDPLNQDTIGPYLTAVHRRYPFVRQILLTDPSGRTVAATLVDTVGFDLSDRPYVRALNAGQDAVLSDLLTSVLTGEPTIVFARTVRAPDATLRGILAVVFYPARLAEILPSALPEDANLSVFDRRGTLVYSNDPATALGEPRTERMQTRIQDALAGRVVTIRGLGSGTNGGERLGAAVPVAEYGWAVSITRTRATVEGPLQDYYRRQVFVLSLVTTTALALALVLSRALSRPLTRLAAQARAFGHGERATLTATGGPPEIGILAEALNAMATEVQHRFAEREAAERRLAFLLDASAELAGSLDYETTLRSVARLAVPELADWCTVHVLEPDGQIRRTALAHTDPEREALLIEMRRRFPMEAGGAHPVAQVIRTGQPVLLPDVTEEVLRSFAHDQEHLQLLRRLVKSFIAVPLVARGVTFGAVAMVMENPGPRYDQADLALARVLGRRAALAVENARLFHESQASLAEAKAALAVREEFLSIASHELRTPLTALKSNLQLTQRRLERGAGPGQLAELVAQANRQTDRLAGLVTDLLDVSRIGAGHFVVESVPTQVGPLICRLVELERSTDPAQPIDLSLPETDPVIEIDPTRLEQVVMNLIENARKYSPAHAPIHVRVSATPDTLTIAVQDEGIGVPPEDQERIFDRFHRAGNVDKGVTGLGLGLHIAREIVRAHDGDLTVTSTPGAGSTFTVVLPRRPDDIEDNSR